jgi:hypothetical protein
LFSAKEKPGRLPIFLENGELYRLFRVTGRAWELYRLFRAIGRAWELYRLSRVRGTDFSRLSRVTGRINGDIFGNCGAIHKVSPFIDPRSRCMTPAKTLILKT